MLRCEAAQKTRVTVHEALAALGRNVTAINAEGARLLQEYTQADTPDKKLTHRALPNSTFATLTVTAESSRLKQIYDRQKQQTRIAPSMV